MTKADDRELLRRLAGERAGGEDGAPRAAAQNDRLAALWAELEAPPVEPAPPGFAGRVMARVREAGLPAGVRHAAPRRDTLTRRFGAVPARLAAASALAAGLVAGAGLGAFVAAPGGQADGRRAHAAGAEGSAEPGESPAVSGALDEETLLAAAVAAATGEGAGEAGGSIDDDGLAAPFVVEPDLADGYLAALAALEEAS